MIRILCLFGFHQRPDKRFGMPRAWYWCKACKEVVIELGEKRRDPAARGERQMPNDARLLDVHR